MLTVDFVLDGQEYTAINGGPEFTFDEAISLLVNCADQDEVDYYWEKLSEGGEESQCGWLKDRFGLSWQVVPTGWEELFNDPDPARAERAMTGHVRHEEARPGRTPGRRRRSSGAVALSRGSSGASTVLAPTGAEDARSCSGCQGFSTRMVGLSASSRVRSDGSVVKTMAVPASAA